MAHFETSLHHAYNGCLRQFGRSHMPNSRQTTTWRICSAYSVHEAAFRWLRPNALALERLRLDASCVGATLQGQRFENAWPAAVVNPERNLVLDLGCGPR